MTTKGKQAIEKALFIFDRTKWKFKNTTLRKVLESTLLGNKKVHFDCSNYYCYKSPAHKKNIEKSYPFILIKPSGISKIDEIKKILNSHQIKVTSEHLIEDYRSLALSLFENTDINELQAWFQILEKHYPEHENNRAKVLEVSENDMNRVAKVKRRIRKLIGVDFFDVYADGQWRETSLTPLHCPDPDRLHKEYEICMQYVSNPKLTERTTLERI